MSDTARVMSTKDAALAIFGNERVGTRQRVVRMIKHGWLTGHQIEGGHNSPYWVSSASVERYCAAIEEGAAAIAQLKRDAVRVDDAA